MSQQFWVKQEADGDAFGPYSADDLRQFVRETIVVPATLISPDRANWYFAHEIETLFPTVAEPVPIHADLSLESVDLQPSAETEVPAAASVATPIDYFNSSSTHAVPLRRPLTPERRFQGVFNYLHICAIALGLIVLGIGANIGSSALNAYESRDLDVPMETIGWLVGFGLTAALLVAAGGLGIVQGRAERLLFVAAVVFIVLRVMSEFMSLMLHNSGQIFSAGGWWPLVVQAVPLVFSLIVPVLCLVCIVGWLRAKKLPAASDARSPWVALARATAAVAILGGGLFSVHYGRTVVEDRKYANYQLPPPPMPAFRTPGQRQRYQWRMSQAPAPVGQNRKLNWRHAAVGLAVSLCIWIGGLIAWFGRWIGQTLLLLGVIAMILFLSVTVAGLSPKTPAAAQLAVEHEEVGSLITFLLFGTFALIRGGIANKRVPLVEVL